MSSQYEQKRIEKNVLTFSPGEGENLVFQVAVGNIWEVGRQQEVKLEAGFFVQGSVHCAQLGIRTRLADEAMVSKTRFAAATNHWHSNKEIQES